MVLVGLLFEGRFVLRLGEVCVFFVEIEVLEEMIKVLFFGDIPDRGFDGFSHNFIEKIILFFLLEITLLVFLLKLRGSETFLFFYFLGSFMYITGPHFIFFFINLV